MYKCAICEKDFKTIAERNQCEAACIKRIEEDAKKLAEEKKMAEKEARRAEVEDAINYAKKLLVAYINDYKSFEFSHDDDSYPYWTSKLLSWFV